MNVCWIEGKGLDGGPRVGGRRRGRTIVVRTGSSRVAWRWTGTVVGASWSIFTSKGNAVRPRGMGGEGVSGAEQFSFIEGELPQSLLPARANAVF